MSLVLVKIMMRPYTSESSRYSKCSYFSSRVVGMTYWVIFGLFSCVAGTVISMGSCWYFQEMVITSWLVVAENITSCRVVGTASMILHTSFTKPIFNISSASSITIVCTAFSRAVPRCMWSSIRPGVATMIWGFFFN